MGITFGIITNGARPAKLWATIASITALKVPEYEIIVVGKLPEELERTDYEYIESDACVHGQLGRMRNIICENAQFDTICITDDDILFQDDFYSGLLKYGEDFDVLCTRLLNPDGSRNWDWVTKGGKRGHVLLEYWETDPYLYCTGGRMVLHKRVWETVKWDESKGFNQEEDVDYSHRALKAGFSIKMNRFSTLVHDDPRYTEKLRQIYYDQNYTEV